MDTVGEKGHREDRTGAKRQIQKEGVTTEHEAEDREKRREWGLLACTFVV